MQRFAEARPLPKEPPFARVLPASARANIRGESFRVYIAIAGFANANADNWCWASPAALAERSGVKVTHLSRAVQQLETAGLIEVERSTKSGWYRLLGVPTGGKAATTGAQHHTW